MNPVSNFSSSTRLLLSFVIVSLMLGLFGCEETPKEPPFSRSLIGPAITFEALSTEYNSCRNLNSEDPSLCAGLQKEMKTAKLEEEKMLRVFKGVKPKTPPIPVPPRPCPQGQCLKFFEGILAIIYPADQEVEMVWMASAGEIIASASKDVKGQFSTILEGQYHVFTLETPADLSGKGKLSFGVKDHGREMVWELR